MAPGASDETSRSDTEGNDGAGIAAASGCRWMTPRARKSSVNDAMTAMAHAMSAAGARGAKRSTSRIKAINAAPSASVAGFACGKATAAS